VADGANEISFALYHTR